MNLLPVNSKSGNITRAGYDPTSQRMIVEFNGGTQYQYENVPADKWTSFAATFPHVDASTGSHFDTHFRKQQSKHPATKLTK